MHLDIWSISMARSLRFASRIYSCNNQVPLVYHRSVDSERVNMAFLRSGNMVATALVLVVAWALMKVNENP